MQKQDRTSLIIAVLMVLAAALSRVLLYPYNFSPMVGMAIFGGAVIKDIRFAFALPIFAMFLSDVIFEVSGIADGFWGWGQLVGYGIFALITVIAFTMKKINPVNVVVYSLLSSLVFFILSNSAFFVFDNPQFHTYPQNFSGYIDTMLAGIPFFKTSIVADLVYSGGLFGAYYLAERFELKKEYRVGKKLNVVEK